jgi:polyphenol oxidase
MWLYSPNIKCIHGFSTRHGGVSPKPFDTLNLGGSEDDAGNIYENRNRALNNLNCEKIEVSLLKQVHGNNVCIAEKDRQEGDALVTNKKNTLLAISVADCFPILLFDQEAGVIGGVHAGWKGTLLKIAENTVDKMRGFGAVPGRIQAAIGQGISFGKFEVGNEVTEKFINAGFPLQFMQNGKIDLAGCIMHTLLGSGLTMKNIWHMNRCTFEEDFFSYRRDKGITGRMWAVIAMQ